MPQAEPLLERWLRQMLMRRTPEWVRYAATLGIIGLCFVVRLAAPFSGFPFLLFIPGLIVASFVFGRGPGLVATATSAALGAMFFGSSAGMLPMTANEAIGTVLFVIIGLLITVLCCTMRATLVRLIRAEREKSLLLDELNHRVKNNLQMVSSLLAMQARVLNDPAAGQALGDAAARVQVIAKLHERLQPDGQAGSVNMRDYLDELCADLSATLQSIRPVSISVGAEPVVLGSAVAAPIGLIVNELITNCFKYAFPEGASGTVSVAFATDGPDHVLTVRDDGVGAGPNAKDGLGSRLTGMLVQQLDGRMTRSDGRPGTLTTVLIPRPREVAQAADNHRQAAGPPAVFGLDRAGVARSASGPSHAERRPKLAPFGTRWLERFRA